MKNDTPVLLSAVQFDFLNQLAMAEGDDHGIPLYVRSGEMFTFLPGYKMATSVNKRFEAEAPEGLYRGGAVILVTHNGRTFVVPDDRYAWFKPFAGVAQHAEGNDLSWTGIREVGEEAFIYDLRKTTRFVPVGVGMDWSLSASLGFTVTCRREIGEITCTRYAVNEKNRSYEAVLHWDISGIDVPFSVYLEEDWFSGHSSGVSVFAINDDGSIHGVFSGQQGLIEYSKLGIHPTLKEELNQR